uniref:TYR_PHOSPHATASE_2 domain-containing protein n=1 Tax=Schistosoma mansoni TaxID=6183 RepID=A0A5K4EXC6_SCHMA
MQDLVCLCASPHSFSVFNNRISAEEAIQYVRFRRPGSIQTQNQVGCIYKFEKYLYLYRIYFGSHGQFSLEAFLKRQNVLLHGPERRRLRNIPKVNYFNYFSIPLFPRQ